MRSGYSFVSGAVAGLVGLALMVLETVRVLNGSTLSGINNVLLFVGLGLVALAGVLLGYAVLADQPIDHTAPVDDRDADDVDAADTEPTDDTDALDTEPADDPA
jgi:hypothetical protein